MRRHALPLAILCLLLTPSIWLHGQKLDVDGSARISEMDTLNQIRANVVIKADGTLAVRQYKIGDLAHGGIVFWVDESGEHGLVVDTGDISESIRWSNDSARVINTGDGIGAGYMNTCLIVAQQTQDNPSGTFAAQICGTLFKSQYGDWYLPSKEELNLIYQNKSVVDNASTSAGGSAFANVRYWSSTENPSFNSVWTQDFDDGFQDDLEKSETHRVRAIRKF